MEKKSFRYINQPMRIVLTLVVLIPLLFAAMVLNMFVLTDFMFYVVAILIVIVVVRLWFPWVPVLDIAQKQAYYRQENDVITLEQAANKTAFAHVTEIMMNEHIVSRVRTIQLEFWSDGKKYSYTSVPLEKDVAVADTEFGKFFELLRASNPNLKQQKNMEGESIRYWYKE